MEPSTNTHSTSEPSTPELPVSSPGDSSCQSLKPPSSSKAVGSTLKQKQFLHSPSTGVGVWIPESQQLPVCLNEHTDLAEGPSLARDHFSELLKLKLLTERCEGPPNPGCSMLHLLVLLTAPFLSFSMPCLQLLRVQLYHMKNMFKTCRLAKE